MRKDHPLRALRAMVDEVLQQLSRRFDAMYAKVGRPSIPPEQRLRAQLVQILYSIRSERLLMEEIDYSMPVSLVYRIFMPSTARPRPHMAGTIIGPTTMSRRLKGRKTSMGETITCGWKQAAAGIVSV